MSQRATAASKRTASSFVFLSAFQLLSGRNLPKAASYSLAVAALPATTQPRDHPHSARPGPAKPVLAELEATIIVEVITKQVAIDC